MNAPEFSRTIDIRQCEGKALRLDAGETERAALAERFGLVRIDRLEADLHLTRDDRTVTATGTMVADFVQSCAVSAEDLHVSVEEKLHLRFVPERTDYAPEEEVEFESGEIDEIDYAGTTIDVGEAVAQSLALAIDPFATGPMAEPVRKQAGLMAPEDTGPFAALKGLLPGKE